ncbi:MAG: histidine kinase [Bacteroidales bacterium]|nr:histidine kinase [Bacteroidales bacterium]
MIAILFIFCCIIDAQVLSQNKIDSLKNLFPGSDTREQVDILNELASIYAPVNFDSSIFYSAQAMRMATISGYAFGIGCSRLYTGNAYYYNLDFKNALISYLSAQTILEEGSHFDELGELCLMLGHINFFIMRSDVAVSYYHKAYDNFKEAGDDSSQADVLYALNMTYWRDGPVDSALAAGERFLNYTRKHHYRSFEAAALINLGMTVWDEKSLRYHDEALKIAKELENFRMVAIIYNNIASYHYEIPSPLSENNVNLNLSRHYYDLVLENAQKVKYYYNIRAMAYLGLAKIDIKEGFYDSAESNLGNCEKIFDSIAQFPDPQPSPIGIYAFGKIFESFITLRTKNEFYASRFELARKTGKPEDAINYQRLYFESGDTLRAVQQGRQLELLMAEAEAEKTDQKIRSLAQENELKKLQFKQSRSIFIGIAAVVVIISLFVLLFFQRKRLKAEQKSIFMEQRLLRAQMNPHFLFNSLASIQNYIINEKTDQASIYLSRFSQLVRNILDNSVEEYVPLEKEIETVQNYLELQKVRYAGKFDFKIEVDEQIDEENMMIPPMLAQPFIENAIEHGIKYRETPGHIDIRFRLEDGLIRFEVEDDGVGREKAHEIEMKQKTKHRSMATSITSDRLMSINKKLKRKIRMEIIDLKNASGNGCGTKVTFGVPVVVK